MVGSPDAERGEMVQVFVVLHEGTSADERLVDELQDFAKRTTTPYENPRRIEFVEELPKTITGEIRRRTLRDREYERGAT